MLNTVRKYIAAGKFGKVCRNEDYAVKVIVRKHEKGELKEIDDEIKNLIFFSGEHDIVNPVEKGCFVDSTKRVGIQMYIQKNIK